MLGEQSRHARIAAEPKHLRPTIVLNLSRRRSVAPQAMMKGTILQPMPTRSNFGQRGIRFPNGHVARLVTGGRDQMPPLPVADWELHAFVDGALDRREASRVADYLAARPDEAARVEAYRKQNIALALLYRSMPLPPVSFERLTDRVSLELRRRRQARALSWFAGFALLIVALACAGVWALG